MQLNLPIMDQLAGSQNVLIAGMGGGFDVFIGLPLYFTLRSMGKQVHLANYSFVDPHLATLLGKPPAATDWVSSAISAIWCRVLAST